MDKQLMKNWWNERSACVKGAYWKKSVQYVWLMAGSPFSIKIFSILLVRKWNLEASFCAISPIISSPEFCCLPSDLQFILMFLWSVLLTFRWMTMCYSSCQITTPHFSSVITWEVSVKALTFSHLLISFTYKGPMYSAPLIHLQHHICAVFVFLAKSISLYCCFWLLPKLLPCIASLVLP